jgi:GT2 family glycosyltransferase
MVASDQTPDSDTVAQARAAMARHQADREANRPAHALRWVERAHRLVPRDPNIRLILASYLLGHDLARAETLFDSVTAEHDVREAWLGLTLSRLRLGKPAAARDSLIQALSRHTPRGDTNAVANELLRDGTIAGWCALRFDGTIVAEPTGTLTLRLDGVVVEGDRLPPTWTRSEVLEITRNGEPLPGSPIDIGAIRRAVGLVRAEREGLAGWAWHPGDPGRSVSLRISDGVRTISVIADRPVSIGDLGPLAMPFGFSVPADALKRLGPTLSVTDLDGRSLYGAPLSPTAERRAAQTTARAIALAHPADRAPTANIENDTPPIAVADSRPIRFEGAKRRRPAARVIIPVHGQRAHALACINAVLATIAPPHRLIVVDDASPDATLREALDHLAARGQLTLLRNERNLGFAGAVNCGLRAAAGFDVVLLNSDTIVPPGWLDRLRAAAHGATDIGTVTPFSNDASILSYPDKGAANPAPDRAGTIRMDARARRALGETLIDIPVGVGFCLYIRRDCLNAAGALRDGLFAQGYGEENDFCLRARALGWRHVALPGLFVAHIGGRSFNLAATHLRARNAEALERSHPGYHKFVSDFLAGDPLRETRRTLDLERWRHATKPRDSVILITHREGGGVEQRIQAAVATHRDAGREVIILRPADDGGVRVIDPATPEAYPNLVYRLPAEFPALRRLLRHRRPVLVEAHHFLGHHDLLHDLPTRLGVPHEVFVHDYGWFCPRVVLVDGRNRYCGEPEISVCEDCIADHGRLDLRQGSVAALHTLSSRLLASARAVVAPSRDTAERMRRHFPGLSPVIRPHADDSAIPARLRRPRRANERGLVAVLGAIGVHKGYDVLLACARDARDRDLNLEFVVIGKTIDDPRLLDTGRVYITGSYDAVDVVPLILAQRADLAFLPSIAPETWCMGLGELWQAGLTVAAFDLGAPAERIRMSGRGFTLPLHLPPGAINNALVNAMASSVPRGALSPPALPSALVVKGP